MGPRANFSSWNILAVIISWVESLSLSELKLLFSVSPVYVLEYFIPLSLGMIFKNGSIHRRKQTPVTEMCCGQPVLRVK